jgi:hypothetical protein
LGHGTAQNPALLLIDSMKYGVTLVWSQDRVPGISMKKIRISKENNILFSTDVLQEWMKKKLPKK